MAGVSRHTKFVKEPNAHLLCPVCKNVFREPVINIKCGHTFCRACVVGAAQGGAAARCPVDAVTCQIDALVVNRALVGQINELEIYCSHGLKWVEEVNSYLIDTTGCPEVIKYGIRGEHEDACVYELVECPNSSILSNCGKLRKRDVEQHMLLCSNCRCPYYSKGCDFQADQQSVGVHTQTCGFRGIHGDASSSQEGATQLQHQVEGLTRRVGELEGDNHQLHSLLSQCTKQIQELFSKNQELNNRMDQMRRSPSSPPGGALSKKKLSSLTQLLRSPSLPIGYGNLSSPRMENWVMPFTFKCIGTLRGHRGAVCALQSTGSILFSAGEVIKVWDLENLTKGCMTTLSGHKDKILAMCLGKQHLYSAGDDLGIGVWSLSDLSLVKMVDDAHEKSVAALACTEEFLFSASYQEIKVWKIDAGSLEQVHIMTGLNHWVRCLHLSLLKDRLYSGCHNTIDIWDATGKFNLKSKISHTYGSVHSLATTPQYIIAGTYNQHIHIYDVTNQQYKRKLFAHVGAVTTVAVSPSCCFAFTGSSDATIQVWNLENFLPIQSLARHEGGVNALALHNDLVLSGAEDTEIKVFKYFKMEMGFMPS